MAVSSSRAKIGLGMRVICTQSGFSCEICDTIDGLGIEGGDIDVTHMGVPTLDQVLTNREKIPTGLAMLTDTTIVYHFDPAVGYPRVNFQETIQLLFPRRITESIPAMWSATGHFKSAVGTFPIEGKMTLRSVIGWTGNLVYTKPTLL